MSTVQTNYTMNPYYDALINVGEPKPSVEAVDGGYVGDEKARESLGAAKAKLIALLQQGKTFDDPEVQKLCYEAVYWENMMSASLKQGERALMKEPTLAKQAHDEAHAKAVSASSLIGSLVNEQAFGTGKDANAEIKKIMDQLDQYGSGEQKALILSLLGNKWKKEINQLESKVRNNTATDQEKKELESLKGSLAVLQASIEGNGTKTFSDEKMNEIFNTAAKSKTPTPATTDPNKEDTGSTFPKKIDDFSNAGAPFNEATGRQYIAEASTAIQALESQGKTILNPEMMRAAFKLAYGQKMVEFATAYSEGTMNEDPDLATTLSNAALAYAMGEVIKKIYNDPASRRASYELNPGQLDHLGANPYNAINDTNIHLERQDKEGQKNDETQTSQTTTNPNVSGPAAATKQSSSDNRTGKGSTDSGELERLSGGQYRAGTNVYANAFEYAEAVFADMAYLMQELLATKADELKKKKDEVAKANDALAALNGAEKSGKNGKNIIKVKENATKEEYDLAKKEGRWCAPNGPSSPFGPDGTYRVQTKESKQWNDFVNGEFDMNLDSHYITNEDYEKLKTKLESYISSRQTDMQKLATDIQRIKDKFDQMWRMVGGLINMQGDLNKALVGNIR